MTGTKMNTQTQEALHKALKVLNCLNNDRVYETAWVKCAINACEKALANQEAQKLKEVMDLASYGQSISRIPAQPLSDNDIYQICQNIKTGVEGQIIVARAIEKAHGIVE
jgi:hypothetical protein